jgi:hypothetical protein
MTMLRGSSEADVEASIDRCWAVLADVDGWAAWTGGLDRVTVLERNGDGLVTVCETVNDARVKKVTVRVAIAYDPPHRLSFTLVESAIVRAMEGAWSLRELGSERTHATFDLGLDPGPIGRLARPLEKMLRPLIVGNRAEELGRRVTTSGRTPEA